jgi:hypothetical protein
MEIQVGGWRNSEQFSALIDAEDYEKVREFKWSANKASNTHTTYAHCWTLNTGKIHLHRVIMGLGDYLTDKRMINHINGNGLDNRKANLEICDARYNSQSYRCRRNFGCVYFDTSMTRKKRYRAIVVLDGVKHQQRFVTEEEANNWLRSLHP